MKIKTFVLFLVVALFIFSLHLSAQEENSSGSSLSKEIYKIVKIIKIKNIYVIYAFKDNKKFEIVSPKKKKPISGLKIKNGKCYEFFLSPYFDNNDYSRFRVTAVEIEGTLIPLGKENNFNVFLTKNLIGLYYVRTQK